MTLLTNEVPEGEAWTKFFAALYQVFGEDTFSAKDVALALLGDDPETHAGRVLDAIQMPKKLALKWLYPADPITGKIGFLAMLGYELVHRRDKTYGEFTLVASWETDKKSANYNIIKN